MKRPIRVLLLEDEPTDAELIERELRTAGLPIDPTRVQSEAEFARAIAECMPDLILADYKLPAFDGLAALAMAKERCPDVPFIFVTGAMGEEVAIETLVCGATDYVLKDRLSKLLPAVERALAEAEGRVQRREAEEALRDRVDELERLNRLMVGRELKMIDLKRENRRLRDRLREYEERCGPDPQGRKG